MKVQYQFVLLSVVFSFLFAGCATSSYNIKVEKLRNSNIAMIQFSDQCFYQINDVVKYDKDSRMQKGDLVSDITTTQIISRDVCNSVNLQNRKIRNSRYHFINSVTDDFLASNYNCQVQNSINNIDFIVCDSGNYVLSSSDRKDQGYDNKNTLNVTEKCFDELRDFLINCEIGNGKKEQTSQKKQKLELTVNEERALNVLMNDGGFISNKPIDKNNEYEVTRIFINGKKTVSTYKIDFENYGYYFDDDGYDFNGCEKGGFNRKTKTFDQCDKIEIIDKIDSTKLVIKKINGEIKTYTLNPIKVITEQIH